MSYTKLQVRYLRVSPRVTGSFLSAVMLAGASCSSARSTLEESTSGIGSDSFDVSSSGATGSTKVDDSGSNATDTKSDGSSNDSGQSNGDSDGELPKFDLGIQPDFDNGDQLECDWTHEPCDKDSNEVDLALGLNCPGEVQVKVVFTGQKEQVWVTDSQLGSASPPTYPILEGSKMVVLSSGRAAEITMPNVFADTSFPPIDEAAVMPAPINPTAVKGDCLADPTLLGTGDCSKTLEDQWKEAGPQKGNDWAEIRITAKVPENIHGLAFDFAFFSVEYPVFYKQPFNDLFVAWLESSKWTGNISFDSNGKPISLNAGYLDFKDAPNMFDCPAPCVAPELKGTALEGHGATRWLTTKAPVEPGDEITLVLGIIDLADDKLDSMVLLDNFRWDCMGGDPHTDPK